MVNASKPGRTTARHLPSTPFSTAATPSRVYWKRPYYRRVCRTVFRQSLERQEIKDALSYLRLIANRNDDAAFERVVNTPTRGIGDRTLDVVRQTWRDRQFSLWQACRELLQEKALARTCCQRLTAVYGTDRRLSAGNCRYAAACTD
ncbi:3'-5' exonuclease [Escherichia coli]